MLQVSDSSNDLLLPFSTSKQFSHFNPQTPLKEPISIRVTLTFDILISELFHQLLEFARNRKSVESSNLMGNLFSKFELSADFRFRATRSYRTGERV